MKAILFLASLVTTSIVGYSQVTILNQSSRKFTNMYVVDYGAPLQTERTCGFIKDKNQLTKTLDSSKKVTLKLNPAKYYNIVCLDTTPYGDSYTSITFLYHVSGKAKLVSINNKNVEADFFDHCTRGVMDPDLYYMELFVNNKSQSNVIKLYYCFTDSSEMHRCSNLFQWIPITKGSSRALTLLKPREADTIFIKYFTETDGVIKENSIKEVLKPGRMEFIIER